MNSASAVDCGRGSQDAEEAEEGWRSVTGRGSSGGHAVCNRGHHDQVHRGFGLHNMESEGCLPTRAELQRNVRERGAAVQVRGSAC